MWVSNLLWAISLVQASAGVLQVEPLQELWATKYGSEVDLSFSGFNSFAHLWHSHEGCLRSAETKFDLAILGAPFDTTVSYRTGARFGPYGIRGGSRRQRPQRGYHPEIGVNPYSEAGVRVIDCGDVPMSPYDPALATDQLETAYTSLLARGVSNGTSALQRTISGLSKDGIEHPRLITLGGDHTIVLPILRALKPVYGSISVIHLDAHLDTWDPSGQLGGSGGATKLSRETHGTFFHVAAEEALLGPSIHLGIRTRLSGIEDYIHDEEVGFELVTTDEISDIGIHATSEKVRRRVGNNPVYISLDIDVVDPGMAPATGTIETGGLLSREVKRIIRGFEGLNIVGVDIVEVSPPFDTQAEITSILAADLVHEFMSVIVAGDLKSEKARKARTPVKDEL